MGAKRKHEKAKSAATPKEAPQPGMLDAIISATRSDKSSDSKLASPVESAESNSMWLMSAETATAVALLLVAAGLHFRVWFHAGPLWRDEINSVNLVQLPLAEIWRNLQYDSFPLLWFLLLKAWTAVGGTSDFAIRGMGLVVGLGMLAAIWRTVRLMGIRVPLLILAVFGLAPTLLTVGDSIRAYGLGSLLLVLLTGSMWRLVQQRTYWRAVETGILALLSVQCLYQNAVMLFAIGTSAALVALIRRDWKLLFTLALIGAVAALSIVPYLPTIAQIGKWNVIIKGEYNLTWLRWRFVEALGPNAFWLALIWLAWAIFAICSCMIPLWRRPRNHLGQAIFILSAMSIGLAAYAGFLLHLGYPTQTWYYLPIMALLAVVMESSRALLGTRLAALRIGILIATVVLALAGMVPAWFATEIRQSNVDLVAARLEALASPDDFIVVNPHYYGVSIARYYHGQTPWSSLPDLRVDGPRGNHYLHAYDRFMAKMDEVDPIAPQLQKVAATLRAGQHVWLVGSFDYVPPDKSPLEVPPASKLPPKYQKEGVYDTAWSQQVAWVIEHNARDYEVIPTPTPGPVNPYESPLLLVFPKLQPAIQKP